MIKKFGYFFGICAYALGAIGGFGYAICCKAYLIAVAIIVLAAMAFLTLKQFFNKLTE